MKIRLNGILQTAANVQRGGSAISIEFSVDEKFIEQLRTLRSITLHLDEMGKVQATILEINLREAFPRKHGPHT